MDLNPEHVQFIIPQGLGHRRIYRDNKVRQSIMDFLLEEVQENGDEGT
jgi:hypothetical protein